MRHHLRSNTWTVTATLRQDHGEDPGWWLTFTDREGQPLRFSMSDREPPEEGIWWRMWQHRQLPEVILDHLEERRTGWWGDDLIDSHLAIGVAGDPFSPLIEFENFHPLPDDADTCYRQLVSHLPLDQMQIGWWWDRQYTMSSPLGWSGQRRDGQVIILEVSCQAVMTWCYDLIAQWQAWCAAHPDDLRRLAAEAVEDGDRVHAWNTVAMPIGGDPVRLSPMMARLHERMAEGLEPAFPSHVDAPDRPARLASLIRLTERTGRTPVALVPDPVVPLREGWAPTLTWTGAARDDLLADVPAYLGEHLRVWCHLTDPLEQQRRGRVLAQAISHHRPELLVYPVGDLPRPLSYRQERPWRSRWPAPGVTHHAMEDLVRRLLRGHVAEWWFARHPDLRMTGDAWHWTLATWAATLDEEGDRMAVRLLHELHRLGVPLIGVAQGPDPLLVAVDRGLVEVVAWLLAHGADPDRPSALTPWTTTTPRHWLSYRLDEALPDERWRFAAVTAFITPAVAQ